MGWNLEPNLVPRWRAAGALGMSGTAGLEFGEHTLS